MGCLVYIILETLLLCCCNIHVSSSNNLSVPAVLPSDQAVPEKNNITIYNINVNQSASAHKIDQKFLAVVLEFSKTWNGSDGRLSALASALSPIDVRVGGHDVVVDFGRKENHSEQDGFVHVENGVAPSNLLLPLVSGDQWDLLDELLKKFGWDLYLGINHFSRTSDGTWDPTYTEQLLDYSSSKGMKIPYFYIGNEPELYQDKYNFTILPEQLVHDYKMFKNLTSRYALYASSKLYGPEVSNIMSQSSKEYLQSFLGNGGHGVVEEISFHHFYTINATEIQDLLNVSLMDSFKETLETVFQIVGSESSHLLPIRLSETSISKAGIPEMSDRYAASFLWLDKLGLAAQSGVTRVFRTVFIGENNGLLDTSLFPLPDYFLSLLYKKLVGSPVFKVSLDPPDQLVRVYAHCAANHTYPNGALVVYFLNLQETEIGLSLPQFKMDNLELYLLTPGDEFGLKSKLLKLNNNTLHVQDNSVPVLSPKFHNGTVTVQPHSFGFVVISTNVQLCRKQESVKPLPVKPKQQVFNRNDQKMEVMPAKAASKSFGVKVTYTSVVILACVMANWV